MHRIIPSQHRLGIHTRLDQLQRDFTANRLGLLRVVDDSEATFPQNRLQCVSVDDTTDLLVMVEIRTWRLDRRVIRAGCG